MSRLATLVLLLLAAAGSVRAQLPVNFTFTMEFTEALEWAPVPSVVTLENRGSETAYAGADYQVGFDITDERGNLIRLRNESEIYIPSKIEPGATISFTNDLHYLYRIDRQGQYAVVAKLQTKGRSLASTKVFLDVVPGSELANAEITLPDGSGRRYALRQISRDRKSYLFIRVDDPGRGLNYGVYELGRFVPLKTPELRVDQHGLAHVLHLAAPNQFLHSVFSPTGDLVAQKNHSGDSNVVRLRADEEAGYQVIGTGVSEPRDPFVESLPSRSRL